MTSEPVHVPQAVFGGDEFWRRLDRLADERGHRGHTRGLVGESQPDNRYRLYCDRCDVAIVEMAVDR
ncbi:hypothetical protein [Plantactinospora sp. CA-290183]|uniref:hypothetical protein n=1 Tax=Plantactinospora sp. CA-290183 TaxID=3240006 RepID=UPI003D920247